MEAITSNETAIILDLDLILSVFYLLIAALVFLALLLLARKVIKRVSLSRNYLSHQIFLIKIPKEKPKDTDIEFGSKEQREDIAKSEAVISSIGGLKAQRGFRAWLFGRDDHFSFEIVAKGNKISFYMAAPRRSARYLEQQIHAFYPEAVIEELEDYNLFSKQGAIEAGTIRTKRDLVFPIKTYQKMDVDPLASIINLMSKLGKDESLAIQYVMRSAKGSWHSYAKKVARRIVEKKSVEDGLRSGGFLPKFSSFLSLVFPSSKKDREDVLDKEEKRLSAVEEEMLKTMEEKNLKAGLDVNIRMIACAKTKSQANMYLENIAGALTEFNNYTYGNHFSKVKGNHDARVIRDFIYRRFREDVSSLLNSEETASIFHFPLRNTETPNILWLTAKSAPAPANLPDEGLLLGYNLYRGVKQDIRFKRDDRRRHAYIIGKSGTGKSVLIANSAIQDIINGEGVCVIDPHGDLITDILKRIPPHRAEDVIIFSPADLERPLALNLLEFDPRYPEQKSFVINEMIGILDKLYDLKATGGPMFEQYMRNAMLLVMEDETSGSTLMEIPRVLSDEKFRKLKLSRCPNQTVVDFWRNEAEKAGGEAALANIVPYITSKLTSFISNDMMRPIIGQQKSAFNVRDVMDKQKILLINLPKGIIGEMNAYLLGMILVGKILIAALSRADMKSADRKDFYLYIDEFQNFTTNSVCQILSEARKYGLSLTIANQYIGQLSKGQNSEIKEAVFGNVGTMISFKVGSEDAAFLVKEFAPVFNEYDLMNIDTGNAYLKLLIGNSVSRPFSLRTAWPLLGHEDQEMADKIIALSRLKYGQDRRLVEAEIRRRSLID